MKTIFAGMMMAALVVPVATQAQDGENSPFAGAHIGIEVMRDSLEANQPASTRDADRNGFGVRVNAGYDAVVGNFALIGAEIGIGTGGKTVDQASLAGGRFKVDPGLTYDATARLGIVPVSGFALYGRAGYRWLKTEQAVTGQTLGNFTQKVTEKGFTYGVGAEYAVSPIISVRAEFNRTKYSPDLRQNKISLGAAFRF
jgi:opacity protein-like surface antigen